MDYTLKFPHVPNRAELDAWFNDRHPNATDRDYMFFWCGIAANAHLSSPVSEQWRKEHGFITE